MTVTAHRRRQVYVLIGLVVLSLNLRPAAVSVGPVLDELRAGLSMGATTAGVVTTLPVLCFAAFGAAAPWCARTLGVHRVMLASLGCAAAGLAIRAFAGGSGVFIAATVLALMGMATANVLLPSLVKLHFPDRIGLLTGLYTSALAIGLTGASVLTVPIAEAGGSWRVGLGAWAVLALLAALPWLGLISRDVRPEVPPARSIATRDLFRSPLAWSMAVLFGAQSMQAYAVFGWLPQIFRDAGFSAQTAGFLLGVTTATSIPLSFLLPGIAVRRKSQAPLIAVLCGCYLVGYLGLILSPRTGWVWAVLIGMGTSIFPLVLTMIGMRSRTSDGTAALSGFAQSVGYLLAAIGPFLTGWLYGVTGGWTVPLLVLTAFLVPQLYAGLRVSRECYIEDDLPAPAVRS